MFLLRILCGVYTISRMSQKTTVPDSTKILKFKNSRAFYNFSFEILLILTLSSHFGLANELYGSLKKLCFYNGFFVAFTVSRMSQKTTVPDSNTIQKSEKKRSSLRLIFLELAKKIHITAPKMIPITRGDSV